MQYVALLRGITPSNPSMRNDKLIAVFKSLGYSHVASVISSGNIIFHSDQNIRQMEHTIETTLRNQLSIQSTVILRTKEQLRLLVMSNPFYAYTHKQTTYLTVTFLQKQPDQSLQIPANFIVPKVFPKEICSVSDNTSSSPSLQLWLEKNYTKQITTRTWQTVERIYKRLD